MRDDPLDTDRLPNWQFSLGTLLLIVSVVALVCAVARWLGNRIAIAVLAGGAYGIVLGWAVGILALRHLQYLPSTRPILRSSAAVLWTGGLYGVVLCAFFLGVGGWVAAGERPAESGRPLGLSLIGCTMVANVLVAGALAMAAAILGTPLIAMLIWSLRQAAGRRGTRVVACLAGAAVGWFAWPVADPETLEKPGTVALFVLLPCVLGTITPPLLLWLADRRAAGRDRYTP